MTFRSCDDEALARDKRAAIHAERKRLWVHCGVPNLHTTPPELCDGPWQRTCVCLFARSGRGYLVVLVGDNGTGKTQLAVEQLRHQVWLQSRTGLYVVFMTIVLDLQDSFASNSRRDIVDLYLRPDLLVIDEIDNRGETGFEDRTLRHIIDQRYAKCKDTILISNMSREEFLESLGPANRSRMVETGGVYECNWESFRKPAATGAPVDVKGPDQRVQRTAAMPEART